MKAYGKILQKVNTTQSCFFEKLKKKKLKTFGFMSRRKEKNKITKIRNQRGGIIVELIEIKNYYKVPVLPQYIK